MTDKKWEQAMNDEIDKEMEKCHPDYPFYDDDYGDVAELYKQYEQYGPLPREWNQEEND